MQTRAKDWKQFAGEISRVRREWCGRGTEQVVRLGFGWENEGKVVEQRRNGDTSKSEY